MEALRIFRRAPWSTRPSARRAVGIRFAAAAATVGQICTTWVYSGCLVHHCATPPRVIGNHFGINSKTCGFASIAAHPDHWFKTWPRIELVIRRTATSVQLDSCAPAAASSLGPSNLSSYYRDRETTKATLSSRKWTSARVLDVDEFLQHWRTVDGIVLMDARSPSEFAKGRIPGAINVPLLDDANRHAVGLLHRQAGRDAAFELALDSVQPCLSKLLHDVREACGHSHRILLYCARGGMRSQSVAMFLHHHGFDVFTLRAGYKGFRNWAMDTFKRRQRICIIGGSTGSGKTEVLQELCSLGAQVVDLENLACHKGSVFGHLGESPQPTSEHFQNLLAIEWSQLTPSQYVFVEDEGDRIGSVHLPASLYALMRTAPVVARLDVPFELRVQRLLATYGPHGAEKLSEAVACFEKSMGVARTAALLDHLSRGELRPVCEEALRTYDKYYAHHLRKGRCNSTIVDVPVFSLDAREAATCVLSATQEQSLEATSG